MSGRQAKEAPGKFQLMQHFEERSCVSQTSNLPVVMSSALQMLGICGGDIAEAKHEVVCYLVSVNYRPAVNVKQYPASMYVRPLDKLPTCQEP